MNHFIFFRGAYAYFYWIKLFLSPFTGNFFAVYLPSFKLFDMLIILIGMLMCEKRLYNR